MEDSQDVVKSKSMKYRLNPNDLRCNRFSEDQQLRKQRRQRVLDWQRDLNNNDEEPNELTSSISCGFEMMEVESEMKVSVKDDWIRRLFSNNQHDQIYGARKFSNYLLSQNSHKSVSEVIQLGLVPRFFILLENHSNTSLQLTTLQVLTDVTTDQIQDVLPPNAITVLLEILANTKDKECKEHVVHILANIVADSTRLRNLVVSSGALEMVLKLADGKISLLMKRKIAWMISNVCFTNDVPLDVSILVPCIPILARLIHHPDNDVVADSCWALKHLCGNSQGCLQNVIDSGVCPRLVDLLEVPKSKRTTYAALETIENIVLGDDAQTRAVVDCNVLPSFRNLLLSTEKSMVVRTCTIISNIAVGDYKFIQAVIDANVLPILFKLLDVPPVQVQTAAAWAITHCISQRRSTQAQIHQIVSMGCIPYFVKVIATTEGDLFRNVIRSLRNILFFNVEDYFVQVEKIEGAIELLSNLRSHKNSAVQKYAAQIMEYF